MTASASYQLAIETSGKSGSIALGQDDQLLTVASLPKGRRHNLELAPTIASLLEQQTLSTADLSDIYVSLGPGSFTGLRIGVTTAKMLALATGCRLVGVPTMDVLVHNAPEDCSRIAIAMNFKRGTVYGGVFERDATGWRELGERQLQPLEQIQAHNCPIIGEALGEIALPESYTQAQAQYTWQVGRKLAKENQFADPAKLSPLYIREPEAVTLWNERASSSP